MAANYLTTTTATSTYLPTATAASTYLTTATATSTYLPTATAASTYLPTATAASTYLPTATAASTYLPTATAATTYATLANFNGESNVVSALSNSIVSQAASLAANYLTNATAASTYVTSTNAATTYFTNAAASNIACVTVAASSSMTTSNLTVVNNFVGSNVSITGSLVASGDVTAFSDARLKTDLQVIPDALAKVNSIHGYTFLRKSDPEGARHAGVVAQEVLAVLPEVIINDPTTGMMSVAYGNISALLIESIRELSEQLNAVSARLDNVEKMMQPSV